MTPGASCPGGYRIGPAAPGQVTALAGIERAAAALFDERELPAALRERTQPRSELEAAQREGRLFVATTVAGEPVGFALVRPLDGQAHLEELDVHPEHGRRGLGRALIETARRWARQAGHSRLTLSTYRNVAWNAPFYARLGFRALEREALGPGLAALLAHEATIGLDPARRVAMSLALDAGDEPVAD